MGFWKWMKDGFLKEADKKSAKWETNKVIKEDEKDRIKKMDREGLAYCPKCKGTSIQYVERKKNLSVGRGIVGNVVAGPIGAAVGAVTSKKYKGFVKCLNCGNQWKM